MEDSSDKQSNAPIYAPFNHTDSRLSRITNSVPLPFHYGASEVVPYVQLASSQSASSIQFNCILPSLATVVSPVALIKTTLTVKLSITTLAGQSPFVLGQNACFSEFPFHSMVLSCAVTFNNSNITLEVAEVLDVLKRLIPQKVIDKYASITPVGPDVMGGVNVPFTTAAGALQNLYNPITPYGYCPNKRFNRGGWFPEGLVITGNVAGAVSPNNTATLTFTLVEPVLISPFSMSSEYGSGGFSGLQSLRLSYQLKSPANMRFIRSSQAGFALTSVVPSASELQLFFLSPHVSAQIPRRNVHPYLDIIRMTTNVDGLNANIGANDVADKQVSLNTINLATMPTKIIIGVRMTVANQSALNADQWLPISNVALTLNNHANLLTTMSKYQLYEASVENGLNGVDYQMFSGQANGFSAANAGTAQPFVPTVGSFIILDVAKDLAIANEYFTTNSSGTFNFYGKVTFNN